MSSVDDLVDRSTFRRFQPVEISVKRVGKNSSKEEVQEDSGTLSISLGVNTDDGKISVNLSVSTENSSIAEYRIRYHGIWSFSGEEPTEEELKQFSIAHAGPRLLAVVSAEISTLASRLRTPRPRLPETLDEK